jgi:hypothetical protein
MMLNDHAVDVGGRARVTVPDATRATGAAQSP